MLADLIEHVFARSDSHWYYNINTCFITYSRYLGQLKRVEIYTPKPLLDHMGNTGNLSNSMCYPQIVISGLGAISMFVNTPTTQVGTGTTVPKYNKK